MKNLSKSNDTPAPWLVFKIMMVFFVLSVLQQNFWPLAKLFVAFLLLYVWFYIICWLCMPLVNLIKTHFANEITQLTQWYNSKFNKDDEAQ